MIRRPPSSTLFPYPPLFRSYSNSAVTPAVLGIFINGFSSILTGLNFIVTIHTMRAPGMTWFRLPLFAWAHYATSLVMVLGRSEEHTSELQSQSNLVCRLLLE